LGEAEGGAVVVGGIELIGAVAEALLGEAPGMDGLVKVQGGGAEVVEPGGEGEGGEEEGESGEECAGHGKFLNAECGMSNAE
jgi:hypothetical protein